MLANRLPPSNADLVSFVGFDAQDVLDASQPDQETTLDIGMTIGTNLGVALDVLHTVNRFSPFEDVLHQALDDTGIHAHQRHGEPPTVGFGLYRNPAGLIEIQWCHVKRDLRPRLARLYGACDRHGHWRAEFEYLHDHCFGDGVGYGHLYGHRLGRHQCDRCHRRLPARRANQ